MSAVEPTYPTARQRLIDQCAQQHGQHIWHLLLEPAQPDVVKVYCYWCPASIEDIWPGSTGNIHMKMGDFTVVDGTHTAQRTVDMPIDIYIREGQRYDVQRATFEKELEVQVTPRTIGITATGEANDGTGAGWCAPSP